MPIVRGLTDMRRTPQSNLRLGAVLAFVAGATNAGGFLAVGQYTSHMTGIVSAMADNLVLGHATAVLAAAAALAAFIVGAMTTAILVNWGLRRQLHSAYSLPLLLEAAVLLVFGLLGTSLGLHTALLVPVTVLLLCFMMGLQNAVISKISRAEIRTTHVTGLVTDFGIELGKLVYFNRIEGVGPVRASRERLRTQGLLIGLFCVGGVIGALGFQYAGYVTTVPLALLLLLLSLRPVLFDMGALARPAT
ncbi:MAG: DUF1275 domain-containing protein [Bacteriovorax sp.]|nr:DUF1275 domain-containing protein [Rhizobacter sp.]